jgi:hypothetical protein
MRAFWLAVLRTGRFLRPDRNQLRRRTDRIEARIIVIMLACMLLGAPILAVLVGHTVLAAGTRKEQAAAATLYRVPARLLTGPTKAEALGSGQFSIVWSGTARARWTAPDGTQRTGEINVSSGANAGSTAWLWTNVDGRAASPPISRPALTALAITLAAVTPLLLGLLLAVGYRVARFGLDRSRLAEWERAWWLIGPEWTGRR